MYTLEEKKAAIKAGKDKLRKELGQHSLADVETISNRLTENPMYVLEMVPGILPVLQLCIGITLGELLIEREEAELATKEGVKT